MSSELMSRLKNLIQEMENSTMVEANEEEYDRELADAYSHDLEANLIAEFEGLLDSMKTYGEVPEDDITDDLGDYWDAVQASKNPNVKQAYDLVRSEYSEDVAETTKIVQQAIALLKSSGGGNEAADLLNKVMATIKVCQQATQILNTQGDAGRQQAAQVFIGGVESNLGNISPEFDAAVAKAKSAKRKPLQVKSLLRDIDYFRQQIQHIGRHNLKSGKPNVDRAKKDLVLCTGFLSRI